MMFALPAILCQIQITDSENPRYCPQNITGFYDFLPVSSEEDTSNYCPQNTAGFYTFNQSP